MTSILNEDTDQHVETRTLILDASSKMTWTLELDHHRYFVLRETGYSFALSGDFREVFAYFRAAFSCAQSILDEARLQVDCAVILDELGFSELAQLQLAKTNDNVKVITVSDCEERDADTLLMLTKHLATLDSSNARSLLAIYHSLKSRTLRLTTVFSDERFYGEELEAESALSLASGNLEVANYLDRQAFEIYDRLGIRIRASRTALRIANRGNDPRFRRYAREEALRWPASSFAVKMKRTDREFAATFVE